MNYLECNPDYYRDEQLRTYLSQCEPEVLEDIYCSICGGVITPGDEHYLKTIHYHDHYCCDDCLEAEVKEHDITHAEAYCNLVHEVMRGA